MKPLERRGKETSGEQRKQKERTDKAWEGNKLKEKREKERK